MRPMIIRCVVAPSPPLTVSYMKITIRINNDITWVDGQIFSIPEVVLRCELRVFDDQQYRALATISTWGRLLQS